ncbi:MAG: DNA-directed RNA polymerase subunit alpha [Candidatus Margulisiibacteriota bacterium]
MSKPLPWVKFEKKNEAAASFVASPLNRGMGTTLGNSLRRVLLSSLSGYALTSINIDGIEHEFSTVPNVVEDVFDIIANLKGVVFKGHFEEMKTLTIDFKGPGKVHASDIKRDSDVEIVNPDHYIAEVSGSGKFVATLTLEKGVGYAPSTQREDQPINTINLDASFSPIVRVNHQVENIRVGKELDYDSLTLDVFTNGSLDVEKAVKEAAALLISQLQLFEALNEKPMEHAVTQPSDKVKESALNLTIDDLELSARSSNCLKRAGIETVSELIEKDMSELIQIKNFGKKSADEINDKLKQYGLALKES